MRAFRSPVPIAAGLWVALTAGATAQGSAADSVFLSRQPSVSSAIAENAGGREGTKPVVATKQEALAGNPLWTIPIGELSATSARPLFSPSRRPPAPPVVAALPPPPATLTRLAKPGSDHPLLTLLGTIVSQSVEIAVFVDEASHDVIRLKVGELHDGWILSSVVGRSAFFQKDGHRAATLALPAPRAEAATPGVAVAPAPQIIPATTKGGARRPPREG